MNGTKERNYYIDNIKAIVIFLMVFGHLLSSFKSIPAQYIYKVIYFFHMPLLIYISGYLSKFNFKKILIQLALPFCVFRLLFVGFDFLIYGKVQFIWNEFGILWYLFSLILFKIMLHLIVKLISERYYLLFFIISIFTGLIAGFIPLGEEFSFSRTFAFFPFFCIRIFST